MALAYRTRKWLSLLILVVGMPLYVVAAVTAVNWADARFGRLPIVAEVTLYLVLGFLWAIPFRAVFRGVGQPDPELTGGAKADAARKSDQAKEPRPSA